MAKPGALPYADAVSAIAVGKRWAGGGAIKWRLQTGKGVPESHKARAALSIKGVIQEGYFVDLFHKVSTLPGVPDKVCFALVANGARILALDENGPSDHMNRVGEGRAFFMQKPNHPHLHIPVEASTSGYAEPIDRVPITDLWQVFLKHANIKGAPEFKFPNETGQMELL